MSEPLGDLCLVLHGHLPYVLNHGAAPHGEAWLHEAAAETYLPLLDVLREAVAAGTRPAVTVGLTPVLLEQLAHERFRTGFRAYLAERADRASQDRREFERTGQPHVADVAGRWEGWYAATRDQFDGLGGDLPAAFAALRDDGQIQLLAGAATHAYAPLLLNDEMFRAQLACGLATVGRHLGGPPPTGLWLPECAYRPAAERWVPPVLYGDARARAGVEQAVSAAGLTHFFVDAHQVTDAVPVGLMAAGGSGGSGGSGRAGAGGHAGQFQPMNETQAYWDRARGWGSPLEPAGVVSDPGPPRAWALARHPRVSEQVWSSHVGYPSAGAYLEFHRKHGEGGLRYHRVTDVHVPLSGKQPYRPADADAKVVEHAAHFLGVVREVLAEHRERTGRAGVVVAPFDAELFGHWWFEGPRFLRAVLAMAAADPRVRLATAEGALAGRHAGMVVRMPEGSWGERGDHSVWLNDKTRWMWETEYRAEGHFLKLLYALPWRADAEVRGLLTRAARQLMLLQASDWPFVVHSGGAVDYGMKRFAGHATRFDRMTDAAERAARGEPAGALERARVAEADLHDDVFPDIDLSWWMSR